MDELLAMDRRFIRIHKVVLRNVHIEEDRTSIITTEDIIKRLIPFLNAQSLRLSIVSFSMRAEDKNVAMYLELFQQHVTFGCAGLKYLGPQSEDYLAFQAKNNSVLAGLSLSGWPKSDRVEDLVIELLRRPKLVLISLSGGRGQIVTMRTIEVGFKLWHESGKPINMSVDTNVSEEELLSLPVPEDVTVTTKRITHKYGVTLLIRWRKENTPDLIFTFEYSSTGLGNSIKMNSPRGELNIFSDEFFDDEERLRGQLYLTDEGYYALRYTDNRQTEDITLQPYDEKQ